jgi:hypothetical protein
MTLSSVLPDVSYGSIERAVYPGVGVQPVQNCSSVRPKKLFSIRMSCSAGVESVLLFRKTSKMAQLMNRELRRV